MSMVQNAKEKYRNSNTMVGGRREKREKRKRIGEKSMSENGYSPPEWTKVRNSCSLR